MVYEISLSLNALGEKAFFLQSLSLNYYSDIILLMLFIYLISEYGIIFPSQIDVVKPM